MGSEYVPAEFLPRWHGIWRRRSGLAGLRHTVGQLQGAILPVSDLESCILSARLADYAPLLLDELLGAQEIVWQGEQAIGSHDAYISLFLKDDFPRLGRIGVFAPGAREQRIRSLLLEASGLPGLPGLKFEHIAERLGGFPEDILNALWELVWHGEATSSSLDALRARHAASAGRYRGRARPRYSTLPRMRPGAVGHWRLLTSPQAGFAPASTRARARAAMLVQRYGVLCRGTVPGFEEMQPLLEELADRGEVHCDHRRSVDGDPQFTAPGVAGFIQGADSERSGVALAACDPANPFGSVQPWPKMAAGFQPRRSPQARIFIADDRLIGYLSRGLRALHTPVDGPKPGVLIDLLKRFAHGSPLFIETINGRRPYRTPWHRDLVTAGFSPARRGYLLPTRR